MNKFLNLTLRTLALTSAIGEFSETRKRMLSASKALLESFTLFDKVMLYIPFGTLPDDLEQRRREIKRDFAHLLRGDTVEQLDAYYEVCFRAAELAREAGVDEVFLEALTKGLVENRATTVAMIDGMGAPPQEGDVFVHGTNLTAMFRGTPAGLGTEKTPVTH